jgi:hypothetical protein
MKLRKVEKPTSEFLAKVDASPLEVQIEFRAFLDRARANPNEPSLIRPPVTKLNADFECETTLPSGFRVLWTIGSHNNEEIIVLFDLLEPL